MLAPFFSVLRAKDDKERRVEWKKEDILQPSDTLFRWNSTSFFFFFCICQKHRHSPHLKYTYIGLQTIQHFKKLFRYTIFAPKIPHLSPCLKATSYEPPFRIVSTLYRPTGCFFKLWFFYIFYGFRLPYFDSFYRWNTR